MRSFLPTLFIPIALTAACVDPPDTDEEIAGADQEGIIFPDGTLPPSESCDLDVPLTCPATTSYSVTYATAQSTGRTATRLFTRSNTAGFTHQAVNHQCTATSDFVVNGVLSWHGTRILPVGWSYVATADNKAVQFLNPNGEPDGIYNGAFSELCGLGCDSTHERLRTPAGQCTAPPTDEEAHQIASVVINGRTTRNIRMAGTIDKINYNSRTGEISLSCRMTIAKKDLFTAPDRRPNDVIGFTGDRFQRGYEFTGTALTNKCNSFASLKCTGQIGNCIPPIRDRCVADFSQGDPCKPFEGPGPR